MSVKIQVTKTDIEEATQEDPYSCMVWRAVTRNLQLESGTGSSPVIVHVDYEGVELSGQAGSIGIAFPEGIGDKVREWDDDKKSVKPFAFDLDLPDTWREQVQGLGK